MNLRIARAATTRESILAAAERLFAEQGVFAVSNRQVSEAAGQGNNTAVGYHFGTKTDLIRAIVREHSQHIDRIRTRLLARYDGSDSLRDWVVCMVRPVADHVAELGVPSWYARFNAQLATDPTLREILTEDARRQESIQVVVDGLHRCLGDLPPEVRTERMAMVRNLVVHTCAERERSLADDTEPLRPTWEATTGGLVDAVVGLLQAPVTPL